MPERPQSVYRACRFEIVEAASHGVSAPTQGRGDAALVHTDHASSTAWQHQSEEAANQWCATEPPDTAFPHPEALHGDVSGSTVRETLGMSARARTVRPEHRVV